MSNFFYKFENMTHRRRVIKRIRKYGSGALAVSLYLMTAPGGNAIGLYCLPLATLAHETGTRITTDTEGRETIHELEACIKEGLCSYDYDEEMVWVHDLAMQQIGALKEKDNQVPFVQGEYESVPDTYLKERFYDKYAGLFHLKKMEDSDLSLSPFEAPSKPLGSPFEDPSKPLGSPFEAPSKPLGSPFEAPSKPLGSPFEAPSKHIDIDIDLDTVDVDVDLDVDKTDPHSKRSKTLADCEKNFCDETCAKTATHTKAAASPTAVAQHDATLRYASVSLVDSFSSPYDFSPVISNLTFSGQTLSSGKHDRLCSKTASDPEVDPVDESSSFDESSSPDETHLQDAQPEQPDHDPDPAPPQKRHAPEYDLAPGAIPHVIPGRDLPKERDMTPEQKAAFRAGVIAEYQRKREAVAGKQEIKPVKATHDDASAQDVQRLDLTPQERQREVKAIFDDYLAGAQKPLKDEPYMIPDPADLKREAMELAELFKDKKPDLSNIVPVKNAHRGDNTHGVIQSLTCDTKTAQNAIQELTEVSGTTVTHDTTGTPDVTGTPDDTPPPKPQKSDMQILTSGTADEVLALQKYKAWLRTQALPQLAVPLAGKLPAPDARPAKPASLPAATHHQWMPDLPAAQDTIPFSDESYAVTPQSRRTLQARRNAAFPDAFSEGMEGEFISKDEPDPVKKRKTKPKIVRPKPSGNIIANIILNNNEICHFYMSDASYFRDVYPGVNIVQEFKKMEAWCVSNPANRKTLSGIMRFVNSWLSKQQNQSGGGKSRGFDGFNHISIPEQGIPEGFSG